MGTYQVMWEGSVLIRAMTYPFSGSKVDTLWRQGNREEAMRQSRLSRIWNIVAIVTGVVIYVIIVAGNVAVVA